MRRGSETQRGRWASAGQSAQTARWVVVTLWLGSTFTGSMTSSRPRQALAASSTLSHEVILIILLYY